MATCDDKMSEITFMRKKDMSKIVMTFTVDAKTNMSSLNKIHVEYNTTYFPNANATGK